MLTHSECGSLASANVAMKSKRSAAVFDMCSSPKIRRYSQQWHPRILPRAHEKTRQIGGVRSGGHSEVDPAEFGTRVAKYDSGRIDPTIDANVRKFSVAV